MTSHLKALARVILLSACAAASATVVHAQTMRLPNSQLPRVGTWPTDGNDATTQWRVPDNAVTPASLGNESAIEQTLNAWAQAVDSQDPMAVADLFTADGTFDLYYINQTTTPWVQAPTGYSPSSTPTGGTAGGGCTARGHTAIANYVRGTGLAASYPWPVPSRSSTLLLDPFVRMNASDPTVATAHSYVFLTPWASGQKANQLFATLKFEGASWKLSELRVLYSTGVPNAPCEN